MSSEELEDPEDSEDSEDPEDPPFPTPGERKSGSLARSDVD
jgi:hypothetical protein